MHIVSLEIPLAILASNMHASVAHFYFPLGDEAIDHSYTTVDERIKANQ